MRLLILSSRIDWTQRHEDYLYHPPYSVRLDVGNLNDADNFRFSLFDYDVSIVHVTKPSWPSTTEGYFKNMPKLLRDAKVALENGRSVICLPASESFNPISSTGQGAPVYDWLHPLGIELQENVGVDIKPSGAGTTQEFQYFLKSTPKYYQIIARPEIPPRNRIAVVGDTEIVIAAEHKVGEGMLVIAPPPSLNSDDYSLSMMRLVDVARRYHERAQRRIPMIDTPEWLAGHQVKKTRELASQIEILAHEKSRYDRIAYVLYGTGDDLENSVVLLLEELGLEVEKQPHGSNIDLKARHLSLGLGFAVEVTGTKGTIQKDSNKIAQVFQHIQDRVGTSEEHDRLIVVANTELHLDPNQRRKDSYSSNVVGLVDKHGVLLLTTVQLYELWKQVEQGNRTSESVIQELHDKDGLFT